MIIFYFLIRYLEIIYSKKNMSYAKKSAGGMRATNKVAGGRKMTSKMVGGVAC